MAIQNDKSGTTGPARLTSATPAAPARRPAIFGEVKRSPSNGTASSAVKSGAVELRMTEYDAGMESAANANSMNGRVELTTPITAYWRQCRASSASIPMMRQ